MYSPYENLKNRPETPPQVWRAIQQYPTAMSMEYLPDPRYRIKAEWQYFRDGVRRLVYRATINGITIGEIQPSTKREAVKAELLEYITTTKRKDMTVELMERIATVKRQEKEREP